jgi:hypothetical protein
VSHSDHQRVTLCLRVPILCHAVLCCTILYRTALRCAVLYCTVLQDMLDRVVSSPHAEAHEAGTGFQVSLYIRVRGMLEAKQSDAHPEPSSPTLATSKGANVAIVARLHF